MSGSSPEQAETRNDHVFSRVAECLYRHNSSGVYYAWVKRGRKQIRRSLKTSDRALANRRLREFRAQVGRLNVAYNPRRIGFMDLAKRWAETGKGRLKPTSYRRRLTCLRSFEPFFRHYKIDQITRRISEDWEIWRDRLGRHGKSVKSISAATFNYERNSLIAILDYAVREGMILENPAEVIQPRKIRRDLVLIPTREQFETLVMAIRNLDTRARPAGDLVELLAYSGMRLGEAIHLRWKDVDFGKGEFAVTGGETGTKNYESRVVPLFPVLGEFLRRYKKGLNQAEIDDRNASIIPIRNAKKAMFSACQQSSLPNFTHHCLRHYFVSNAIEKGIDYKVIASWVGHKDGGLLVAKTYGHLRIEHSRAMAKLMDS